jgi:diguanylate cyclase (GGDEF)-like protein
VVQARRAAVNEPVYNSLDMDWKRVVLYGLGDARATKLEAALRIALPGIPVERAVDSFGLEQSAIETEGLLFLLAMRPAGDANHDGDGITLLEHLRERDIHTPTALVVAEDQMPPAERLAGVGPVAVLPETCDSTTLRAALLHLETLVQAGAISEELRDRLAERGNEIEVLREQLLQQAGGDEVTGLLSEKAMARVVEGAFRLARRHHADVACILVGIDGFEALGDRFGEAFADLVTVQTGLRLRRAVRMTDMVSRHRAGQFLILSPFAHRDGASCLAQRLHGMLGEQRLEDQQNSLQLSHSIGVSIFNIDMTSSLELVGNAIKGLEDARSRGGNEVCVL